MHTNGHTERNAISSNTNYLQSKEIALLQINPQMKVISDPTKLMRLRVTHLTTKHCLQPPTQYGLTSEHSFKQSGVVARQNQTSFNAFQETPFLHENPKSHWQSNSHNNMNLDVPLWKIVSLCNITVLQSMRHLKLKTVLATKATLNMQNLSCQGTSSQKLPALVSATSAKTSKIWVHTDNRTEISSSNLPTKLLQQSHCPFSFRGYKRMKIWHAK